MVIIEIPTKLLSSLCSNERKIDNKKRTFRTFESMMLCAARQFRQNLLSETNQMEQKTKTTEKAKDSQR